jgi:hypothetical protein
MVRSKEELVLLVEALDGNVYAISSDFLIPRRPSSLNGNGSV